MINNNNFKRNLHVDDLIKDAVGNNEAVIGLNGALMVETGEFSGRIQNDKFIPDTVTKEDALNYYRILKEMGIENPLGVLSDIDSKIMNTPIRKRNK